MDWSNYTFSLKNSALGESPPIFYLEVVIRTTVLYLIALILVRIIGKRGMSQLAPFEFVVLIAMGSALGDPMFYPDVALLPPMLVLITIVALHRTVSILTERHKRLEAFIEGQSSELIRDGIVQFDRLHSETVSFDELAMLLRQKGIENLAHVRLAVLEPSGKLSVFPFKQKTGSGLPLEALLPETELPHFSAGQIIAQTADYCCLGCGSKREFLARNKFQPCTVCSYEEWTEALS